MSSSRLADIPSAVILGASRGIGAEISRTLAKSGVPKLYLLARSQDKLQNLKNEIKLNCDTQVETVAIDLLDTSKFQNWVHKLEDQGEFPRHWIFNIGGAPEGFVSKKLFDRCQWDEVESMIDLNLLLPMKITHMILPELMRPDIEPEKVNAASLIYVSSGASLGPRPGLLSYATSKRALNAFVETLREEVAEVPIRVCNVLPGMVDTSLHLDNPSVDRAKMIQTEDIANAVKFLLELGDRSCPTQLHIRPQVSPIST